MKRFLRWMGWAVAGLALLLVWHVDSEPPLVLGSPGGPASRMQVLPLAEYRSGEAAAFGALFPVNGAGPTPRLHVVARDTRAPVLALALDRGADRLLTEAFPALRTPAESASRLALESALQQQHDWNAEHLTIGEFVTELSRVLGTPIELNILPEFRDSRARHAIAGPLSHSVALQIAAQCAWTSGCLMRDGRLILERCDPRLISANELWVLPPGVSGERVTALSYDTAPSQTLRGLAILHTRPFVGDWPPLARLAAAPLEAPPAKDANESSWRERVVEIPAGSITLGELARLIARQTGEPIWVGAESTRSVDLKAAFRGPLSEWLSERRGHLYLREDEGACELRRLMPGRSSGSPVSWRYYPLSELGSHWANSQPRLWQRQEGSRDPQEASPLGSLWAFARVGAMPTPWELAVQEPGGLFLCRVRSEHDELAKAFDPQGELAKLVYQVHSGPRAARAAALRRALAGNDPLARAFALWNLDDSTVPADHLLLLNLLRTREVPPIYGHDFAQLAWIACRRWCSVPELTAAIAEILRTEPRSELGGPHHVALWGSEAGVPELEAAVADWLSRELTRTAPPDELLDFALRLALRPTCRDVLKDVLLDAHLAGLERREGPLHASSDLAELLLEALRDSRPEQRRRACRLLAKCVLVVLPSRPSLLGDTNQTLERLRHDPLVADVVPTRVQALYID